MTYTTLKLDMHEQVAFLQFDRPEARNAINAAMIGELREALDACEADAKVLVLSGSAEYFSFGADFAEIRDSSAAISPSVERDSAAALYDVWHRLASGPLVSIAHVRGRVNAGGTGFVAACDIAITEEAARFSLSEMLFGLFPACVLPFLIRRIGLQRANYLTLSTQTINAQRACEWGLVDAVAPQSEPLLRQHLARLKCLTKDSIERYKRYRSTWDVSLAEHRSPATAANRAIFTDHDVLAAISRYVDNGRLPWER